jgi:hypothetical protein
LTSSIARNWKRKWAAWTLSLLCDKCSALLPGRRERLHPEAGELLDGDGGFCVWGKQTPAIVSLERGLLPLGVAQNVKLKRDVSEDDDESDNAVKVRREMEAAFGRRNVGAEPVS